MRTYKLLGTFEVADDGVRVEAIMKRQKGCALLAYLIATRQTQRREAIADMLWEAKSTRESLSNLRALLPHLRRSIPELTITRQTVTFAASQDSQIDLYTLNVALDTDDPAVLDQGLRLHIGDLLDGFYLEDAPRFNEWLLPARERLRSRVLDAYRRVCVFYEENRQWEAGIDAARRLVAVNDLIDEDAYRFLMRFSGGERAATGGFAAVCAVPGTAA